MDVHLLYLCTSHMWQILPLWGLTGREVCCQLEHGNERVEILSGCFSFHWRLSPNKATCNKKYTKLAFIMPSSLTHGCPLVTLSIFFCRYSKQWCFYAHLSWVPVFITETSEILGTKVPLSLLGNKCSWCICAENVDRNKVQL